MFLLYCYFSDCVHDHQDCWIQIGDVDSVWGYVDWFQMVVKLILEKLPDDSRAIFMQTDVKAEHPSKNDSKLTCKLGWFIYIYMRGVNPPKKKSNFRYSQIYGEIEMLSKIDYLGQLRWIQGGGICHGPSWAWILPNVLSLVGDQRWRSREKCKGWQLFAMVRQSTFGHSGCLTSAAQLVLSWDQVADFPQSAICKTQDTSDPVMVLG